MDTHERLIIGLYSPAPQSGKSTVAGILEGQFGFSTRSFASALKRMVIDLLVTAGYSPEEVGHFMAAGKEEPIPALGNVSFRYLCQTIGTEWGRNLISNNLWVDLLVRNPNLPNLLVIDDVRFPNEFDAIRSEGGQVWRISRPSGVVQTSHVSEGLLEGYPFDEEIVNDSDVTDLGSRVASALASPF